MMLECRPFQTAESNLHEGMSNVFRSIQNVFSVMLFGSCLVMTLGCAKTDPKPEPGPKEVKDAKDEASKKSENKTTPKEVIADKKDLEKKSKDKVVDKGDPNTGGTKAPQEGPATNPTIKTTAEAMAKEVFANKKVAEMKYKDTVVELEGQVQTANFMVGNGKWIILKGATEKKSFKRELTIMCMPMAAGLDKAWWLGEGQKVKVIGQVVRVSSDEISLERCTITEQGPNPTEKVTAENLTAAFAKDEAAATTKYITENRRFQEIIVEGTVADSGPEANPDFFKVKLAGKDGLTVYCFGSKETLEGLKKGDKVTIKGFIGKFDKGEKHLIVGSAFLLKK